MRIRKRTSSQSVVAVPATVTPQPISCKYQTMTCSQLPRERRFPECNNMQENRCLKVDDHEASRPDPVNVSNAHVKDEARRPQASPTKRRKIEHDSTMNLDFKGSDAMTAAELLAVAELANGVRQRLAASEQSTSEQDEICEPAEEKKNNVVVAAVVSDANSKDALISSIFYVFDTHGDHGLSASEVVKHMIEQRLPGLKEGGARHTVQVANVLRSSSSFFSLGDKKYMLCSNVYGEPTTTAAKASSKARSHKPSTIIQAADDSLENINEPVKPSNTRKKVQPVAVAKELTPEGVDAAVRVARRRGPSSAQKGKGPTQCKRYDGRGWQCSRLTEPGYSLCSHHQDLINKRAAKLKDQQTLSRLMESVQRKAKQQPTVPSSTPPTTTTTTTPTDDVAAPLQSKRKMLSLLAINK